MTSPGRVYVVLGTLLVFLLLWAAIAARPWTAAATDPRVAALAAREAQVRRAAIAAQQAHTARWDAYRAALAERLADPVSVAAPTPEVRVVQLPPDTTTRSS